MGLRVLVVCLAGLGAGRWGVEDEAGKEGGREWGGSSLGLRPCFRMVSCCPACDFPCLAHSGSPKILQPYSPSVRLKNGARSCRGHCWCQPRTLLSGKANLIMMIQDANITCR